MIKERITEFTAFLKKNECHDEFMERMIEQGEFADLRSLILNRWPRLIIRAFVWSNEERQKWLALHQEWMESH